MGILLLGQLPFPLLFVARVDLLVAVASPGWNAACMKGMTEEVRLPKILGSRRSSRHCVPLAAEPTLHC